MKIKKSTCKIAKEDFNNCPGRSEVKKQIKEIIGKDTFNFVDLVGEQSYWKNDPCTMVIELKEPILTQYLQMGIIANRLLVDEYDWTIRENRVLFRYWWD